MKTIVMADPHLGKFWKINNSTSNRAQKLFDFFIYNFHTIPDKENTNLIIAGDMYDSIHANIEMLIHFKQKLDSEFEKFNEVYFIAGNHESFIDKYGKQRSLLDLCVNKGIIVNSNTYSYVDDNINYVLVPYQINFLDELKQNTITYLRKDMPNIIIAHETPKEIFSYAKFSMNEVIDLYTDNGYDIPYILLGHYHKCKQYTYKNTTVISIGNSYYLTIDDVKDGANDKYNDNCISKRYLIIDKANHINRYYKSEIDELTDDITVIGEFSDRILLSNDYGLPKIYSYKIENQVEFDDKYLKIIRDNNDKNCIYLLSSNVLIDYSQAMFEGYDIYFDLIENPDDSIITLNESNTIETLNNINTGKTLDDRWNRYLDSISTLDDKQKKLASFLFNKRNDSDININNLVKILSENEGDA